MANINLELARMPGSPNRLSAPCGPSPDKFNIGAALKLVPVFDERNVPEFFKAFERVATRLSWPTEMWTVLIQCRLVGKAIRVYNSLEEGVARDYNKVKALVLKAYDLVPDTYRLKFRNFAKHPALSFVEFARLKEEQFDDWLKSRQVASFSSLRELMLLEAFKKHCSRELRIYLEEVKAVSLSKAAQIADEFVLTHRAGSGNFGSQVIGFQSARPNNFNTKSGNVGDTRVKNSGVPTYSKNENGQGKVSSGGHTRVFSKNRLMSGNVSTHSGSCFWCNKPGHYQAQCNARRRYLQRNGDNSGHNPISVISNKSISTDPKVENPSVIDSGNVISGDGSNVNPSGAPLVEVELSFPGYNRVTELAVVESLPIPGIDGILGNDMLDHKGLELFPILTMDACPVAVMTRASAKAANVINDDDLDLSSLEVELERPGPVDSSSSISKKIMQPDWDRIMFIEAQKQEFDFELGDTADLTKPRFCVIKVCYTELVAHLHMT
ncbi:uncharacterized protein [Macrobrachium rosenbergii]|uniref:uncharacterized protein n=1 Tax=Macrobrachium rosenbergii TaxID=79674 RepID=UPI0034D3F868